MKTKIITNGHVYDVYVLSFKWFGLFDQWAWISRSLTLEEARESLEKYLRDKRSREEYLARMKEYKSLPWRVVE